MAEQNKKNKPTLEEALMNNRPEQVPDEPTLDEVMTQAMAEDSAQQRFGQTPPQGESLKQPLPLEKKEVDSTATAETIPSQPETVTETTPASSTDPQPANEDSIPGSQDPAKGNPICDNFGCNDPTPCPECCQDPNLRRLVEFVNSNEFSVDWVRLHLGHISRIPQVIPSITIWDGTNFEQVASHVFDTIRTAGYVENVWPVLSIVMGSSRDNTRWSAGVLCTMALFDTIKLLPFQTQSAMAGGKIEPESDDDSVPLPLEYRSKA